jgi:hypothetical protein
MSYYPTQQQLSAFVRKWKEEKQKQKARAQLTSTRRPISQQPSKAKPLIYQRLLKDDYPTLKRKEYDEMDIKRTPYGGYEDDLKPSFEEYCKDRAENLEKRLNIEYERKNGKNSFAKTFEKFSGYAAFFFVVFYGALFISSIILLNNGTIQTSHYLRCNLTLSFFMFLYGIVLAVLWKSNNLLQLQETTGTFFLLLLFIGIIVAVGPTVQKLKLSFSISSQSPSSSNPTEPKYPKYPKYLTIGFYCGFFIACAYFIPVFLIWLLGSNCLLATNGVSYSVCKWLHR